MKTSVAQNKSRNLSGRLYGVAAFQKVYIPTKAKIKGMPLAAAAQRLSLMGRKEWMREGEKLGRKEEEIALLDLRQSYVLRVKKERGHLFANFD